MDTVVSMRQPELDIGDEVQALLGAIGRYKLSVCDWLWPSCRGGHAHQILHTRFGLSFDFVVTACKQLACIPPLKKLKMNDAHMHHG